MKYVFIILCFLQGCAILAQDQYFKVENGEKISGDTHNYTECYLVYTIKTCTNKFESKSLMIGFILPVVPPINRGRLSYHSKGLPRVRLNNSAAETLELLVPPGVLLCSSEYSEQCVYKSTIELPSEKDVWLILPNKKHVTLQVESKGIIKLKHVKGLNYHLVSV